MNYRRFSAAQVRAGRFKVPFGREQLASIFEFDFMERSLINTALVPARDTGVLVHGELASGIVAYDAGLFAHDGDNARVRGERVGDRLRAARGVVRPWARRPGLLRTVETGAAFTITSMGGGPFGAEGRMLSGHRFADRADVTGQRTRIGVNGAWKPGPVGIRAEYIRLSDDRRNLPDAIADGWYVSAAWNITGERQDGNGPLRPLFQGGTGTVEISARIESLRFGRLAADARETGTHILTLGLNWVPNRWGRLMFNVTRENLSDPAPTPLAGRTGFWGAACRLQAGI